MFVFLVSDRLRTHGLNRPVFLIGYRIWARRLNRPVFLVDNWLLTDRSVRRHILLVDLRLWRLRVSRESLHLRDRSRDCILYIRIRVWCRQNALGRTFINLLIPIFAVNIDFDGLRSFNRYRWSLAIWGIIHWQVNILGCLLIDDNRLSRIVGLFGWGGVKLPISWRSDVTVLHLIFLA
jgi:hypothetical protein